MPSDPSTNSRRAQTFPRGTECILLAEDEPMVRQLAVRFLSHSGYRVLEAESGVAALDLWANHANDIDLLLTDLVMPGGISGRELAQRCLATKPSLKVIYTSGYSADFDELEPSLRRGHQFLPKPYRLDTLSKLLRECLDEKPRE